MRAIAISKKGRARYRLFLLLIAPILIGLVFFFTPQAHSEWEKEDKTLQNKSPKNQGWAQVEFNDDSSPHEATSPTEDPIN